MRIKRRPVIREELTGAVAAAAPPPMKLRVRVITVVIP
jgi:hypothetical protein